MLSLLKADNFKPINQFTYDHKHKFKDNFMTAQGPLITLCAQKYVRNQN